MCGVVIDYRGKPEPFFTMYPTPVGRRLIIHSDEYYAWWKPFNDRAMEELGLTKDNFYKDGNYDKFTQLSRKYAYEVIEKEFHKLEVPAHLHEEGKRQLGNDEYEKPFRS